jgi:hypothetical protein
MPRPPPRYCTKSLFLPAPSSSQFPSLCISLPLCSLSSLASRQSPQAACSDAFASTLLAGGRVLRHLRLHARCRWPHLAVAPRGSCDLTHDPGKLTAGSRSCQLATIDGVRGLAPSTLPNTTCLYVVPGLEFMLCGMAATVTVCWTRGGEGGGSGGQTRWREGERNRRWEEKAATPTAEG